MLSKTAETNPSPNAVCQDASGRDFTGIRDAHHTRERRKTAPLAAPGSSPHAGLRKREPTRIATHTPYQGPPAKKPSHGPPANMKFAKIAPPRIRATTSS